MTQARTWVILAQKLSNSTDAPSRIKWYAEEHSELTFTLAP